KCGLIIKVLWIGKLERRWQYDKLVKKSFCFERSGSKRSEQSNLVLYNYKFEPASSYVPNLYAAAAMDLAIDGVCGTGYEYLGLYWPQHCYPCDYLWAGILTVE